MPPVPAATMSAPTIHPGKPPPRARELGIDVRVMMSRPTKYTAQKTAMVLKRPHLASAIMAPKMGVMYAKN
jgi:hypothetical protein